VSKHASRCRAPLIATFFAVLSASGISATAAARPTAPAIVCKTYPNAPDCGGKVVNCAFCHDGIDPPAWNAFGTSVKGLVTGRSFETSLPEALRSLDAVDSDGDGRSNLDELNAGTLPGRSDTPMTDPDELETTPNPRYQLDGYDVAFAFRRASTLYCGRSPSYDEMQRFRAAPNDEATLRTRVHAVVAECLNGEYWQKTALPRLADKRIRPLIAAGADSKIKISGLRLVIGDYHYDYRMWRYILSNDRDMRELLTADYHVVEDAQGQLVITRETIPKPDMGALAGGQPLLPERRAGMITTQWFLTINTMFSALPRTSAAQAYRAYLGADISSNEGLRPVLGEPSDIDNKGVAQPRCANCHSTLDPLAYAFARYEGIEQAGMLRFGDYIPDRPARRMPGWDDTKQQSYVLGQPVNGVVEWAKVASESDEFKRNMAEAFFVHALGRKPTAADQAEFNALWRAAPEDSYSANRMIHRLIDTLSFGAP